MCTKTIQNETAKRRELQDRLRPIAKAVFNNADDKVVTLTYELVLALGIRTCCITFPGEAHGSQGYPCILR